MPEGWFWSTPQWAEYLCAYGREHEPHAGPLGNYVIELTGIESMWQRIKKETRADIRKGERIADEIVVVTERNYDQDGHLFPVFQDLHLKDAGRVTRPQRTWDLMREWIADGYGMLLLARYDTHYMAGIYLITYGEGAYYAVAARHPDLGKAPLTHALIWRAMQELQGMGYCWLDMGPVPQDEDGISQFKRHFGAAVWKQERAA